MLPNQCGLLNMSVPQHFQRWINIKKEFKRCYKIFPGGMTDMLSYLKIPLVGRHHSGIDDTRNIASVLIRMIQDGFVFLPTTGTLPGFEKPVASSSNPTPSSSQQSSSSYIVAYPSSDADVKSHREVLVKLFKSASKAVHNTSYLWKLWRVLF